MMPLAAIVIWIVTLLIIALVIVPVAVTLLRRALNAAWAIEGYLADMSTAGGRIATHTGAGRYPGDCGVNASRGRGHRSQDRGSGRASGRAGRAQEVAMIAVLTGISVVLALVIVLVVAYHLIGIFVALKRGADHLQNLADGLIKVRDDTAPLNGRVDGISARLEALAPPLLAANGNLAAIVGVARGMTAEKKE